MAQLGLPTQAITEDFGGIAQQGAAMLNQQRLQQEAKAERDYQKKLDFEDRYGIDESLFNLEDTQFRTVNDVKTEAVATFRDRYYDVYKQLEKDPTNLELKKRLGRIKNSVTSLSQSHEKIRAIGEDYLAKIESGEISGVDEEEWKEILESTDKGLVKVRMDDNDSMELLFYNEDGELNRVMPYKELINGSLIKAFDTDTETNELVKSLGGFTTDSKDGMYIRTTNLYGSKQKDTVNKWVDAKLQDNDSFSDLLYQATGQKKRGGKDDPFTDTDKEVVRSFIQDQVKGKYSETDSLKADTVKQGAANRAAQAQARAATSKNASPDDIQLGTVGDEPLLRPDGGVEFTMAKGVDIDPDRKLSRKVNGIIQYPDGEIALRATDSEKIKGVQGEDGFDLEATAKEEGVTPDSIFAERDDNNNVTYYKRKNVTITMENEPDAINRLGNIIGVNDQAGFDALLRSKYRGRFEDKANAFYNSGQGQNKSKGGEPKLDAFGNPIEN